MSGANWITARDTLVRHWSVFGVPQFALRTSICTPCQVKIFRPPRHRHDRAPHEGKAHHENVRLRAAQTALDYLHGKPTQSVEVVPPVDPNHLTDQELMDLGRLRDRVGVVSCDGTSERDFSGRSKQKTKGQMVGASRLPHEESPNACDRCHAPFMAANAGSKGGT